MRNLLTVVLVLGSSIFSQAQNKTSEITWLQNNKSELDMVGCPSNNLYGGHLEINDDYIKLYDDNSACNIKWKNVKSVTKKGEFINIISNGTNPVEILFYVKDEKTKENFYTTLNNISDSNNMSLVKK